MSLTYHQRHRRHCLHICNAFIIFIIFCGSMIRGDRGTVEHAVGYSGILNYPVPLWNYLT